MRTATLLLSFLGTFRRAVGFGPTTRPPQSWSAPLLVVVAIGAGLQLTDALTTFLLLTDPARPYVIESNPLMSQLLDLGGWGAFGLAKLAEAIFLVLLVEYALQRGISRPTIYGMAACGIFIGALTTAFNSLQLLAGPLLF